MYDNREERINALVMKQRQKLNRKVEETLATCWNQWSAQAAELQVLQPDAEKTEGKKEKASTRLMITAMIWEDLIEDFRALADAHTKGIGTLLEKFNDDQMLFTIEMEQALNDNTLKQLDVVEALHPHAQPPRHYGAATKTSL